MAKCIKCGYDNDIKTFTGKGGLVFHVESDGRVKIEMDNHVDLQKIGIFESLNALYDAVDYSKSRDRRKKIEEKK